MKGNNLDKSATNSKREKLQSLIKMTQICFTRHNNSSFLKNEPAVDAKSTSTDMSTRTSSLGLLGRRSMCCMTRTQKLYVVKMDGGKVLLGLCDSSDLLGV